MENIDMDSSDSDVDVEAAENSSFLNNLCGNYPVREEWVQDNQEQLTMQFVTSERGKPGSNITANVPSGSSPSGSDPAGSGPSGSGPAGSGPSESSRSGGGPSGSGLSGSGPSSPGPSGSGLSDIGPSGSDLSDIGPSGSGPSGSGPLRCDPLGYFGNDPFRGDVFEVLNFDGSFPFPQQLFPDKPYAIFHWDFSESDTIWENGRISPPPEKVVEQNHEKWFEQFRFGVSGSGSSQSDPSSGSASSLIRPPRRQSYGKYYQSPEDLVENHQEKLSKMFDKLQVSEDKPASGFEKPMAQQVDEITSDLASLWKTRSRNGRFENRSSGNQAFRKPPVKRLSSKRITFDRLPFITPGCDINRHNNPTVAMILDQDKWESEEKFDPLIMFPGMRE